MEIYERHAAEAFPKGHYRVREGKLLPDDLVWHWVNKRWRRHDSAEWDCKIENAEDAVFAVRKPKVDSAGFGSSKKYVMTRVFNPGETPEPVVSKPQRGQGSLFSDAKDPGV